MKRLNIRLLDDEHDKVQEIADKLGVSMSDLYKEALFHFLIEHKEEINRSMQQQFLDDKIKSKQKALFFRENWMRRIVQQVGYRIRVDGDCDHKIALSLILDAENYFRTLNPEIQELLTNDLKSIQNLKDERKFIGWIEEKLGVEFLQQKINRRRIT